MDLMVMKELDSIYTNYPFFGARRMVAKLIQRGYTVNRKKIRKLMIIMGLEAIYPKPRLSERGPNHKIYPYLLREVEIVRVHQVWGMDITYIPMKNGFMYLVAIIDWYSRYVLAWRLSNTLDTSFCIETLEDALTQGRPEIFNSDQGSQFTSLNFTERLQKERIRISMDGRGRAFDNIFIERLWRSVKYEDIYIKEYATVTELEKGLFSYFSFYNDERPHQSLGYKTPAQAYSEGTNA